jgi:copper chaperone CopZ
MCEGCANLLTDRIGQVPGVDEVQVDVEAKTVTVTGEVDQAAVTAAIGEAGHRTT